MCLSSKCEGEKERKAEEQKERKTCIKTCTSSEQNGVHFNKFSSQHWMSVWEKRDKIKFLKSKKQSKREAG